MARTRVMCTGDSNTLGLPALVGGYRLPLASIAVGMDFVGGYELGGGHHEGYSGAQISTLTTNVLPIVDDYAPKVVLLMVGTNDIAAGDRTVAQIHADLLALAEAFLAKASVTHVLVGNIAPRDTGDPFLQDTIDFNAGLPAAFAGASTGISVHDICSGVTFSDPDQMADTLHMNATGYLRVARAWYAAMRSLEISTGGTGVSTSTSASIRDLMASTIAALTPGKPGGKYVLQRMATNDFRLWAEANPNSCYRRFSVREAAAVEGPEVSNLDVEWVTTAFEVVVAYPLDNRSGPQMALDRDDVMELDIKQIDGAVGLKGFAALELAAACTVMGAPTREREQGQACAFQTLRIPIGYWRAL